MTDPPNRTPLSRSTIPTFTHIPVMPEEVANWLQPSNGACVVDGTVGTGGHALQIVDRIGPEGQLIGLDRDSTMLEIAKKRLHTKPATFFHESYVSLRSVLDHMKITGVDAVLLDLGFCTDQLHETGRGFSFSDTGSLDLRFNTKEGEPAHQILNRLSKERLADIFFNYGEERFARRIARHLTRIRKERKIESAKQLADLVCQSVPRPKKGYSRIHPATRVFQALRIAINCELEHLKRALISLPECLVDGGRLVVISFHSLEDRIVKQAFRDDPNWKILTKRPLRPSNQEISANPKARSAKLRVAQKQASN